MALHVCCIVTDAAARFAPDVRIDSKSANETRSRLRAVGRPWSKDLLYRGVLQDRSKRGIRFHSGQFLVAFVLGLSQVNQASLQVARFREGLCEQEIKSPAVAHGAVLQNRLAPRASVVAELVRKSNRLNSSYTVIS